ncbi:hypothetical protein SDC9_179233 [bioreactor metagenome]|uniref:Uncharacterized protein n=1 Tax=bioreactor metagenome TaxID=1076179 RepID=A0A645GYF2_9ZZZZ
MMDGSGKLIGILTVSSVSILPFVLSINLSTVLSHFITESEGVFLYVLQAALILWSFLLLVSGLKAIHEFSLLKTFASLFFSVCAIAVMFVIALLLWSLYQQIAMFVSTLFDEISFMMR